VTSGNARITYPTRLFIDKWLDTALSPETLPGIGDNTQVRQFILERERLLKRSLARLENPRALELWSGAAGTQRLNYRWPVSQTIISDVLNGLSEGGKNA